MNIWAFDIETGPASDAEIERMAPDFDPASVKTGNLADLKKIAEKVEGARVDHFAGIKKRAALRAEFSSILALGWLEGSCVTILDRKNNSEAQMLAQFWDAAANAHAEGLYLAGHYITGFDLPYMVRRSFVHGLVVPRELRPQRYRFWGHAWFDTAEAWNLGDPQSKMGLDRLAKFLGVEGKSGTGERFGELYKTDRLAALDYLRQDVRATKAVAEKLWLTLEAGGPQ